MSRGKFPLTVAALYVETDGCYFGLPGVDPWDEARDARLYDGPYPVVAHPPCDRWHMLSAVNHKRWGFKINDDGGCFAAALRAVRKWGGVLEHPAQTRAFRFHGVPQPNGRGWQRTFDGEWITEVDQSAYGHRARKSTWLIYCGENPPPELDWRETRGTHQIGNFDKKLPVMAKREALATPTPFRDLLLSIARKANSNSAREPNPLRADSQRGVSIELPHASLATVSEPVHVPQHAALHNGCQCEVSERPQMAQVRQ